MLDTKTRDEILLEERIAQIDDINFDKIYDVDDFATKQIENFNEPTSNIILNSDKLETTSKEADSFEVEVGENVFLDNFSWDSQEEVQKKAKFKINNKLLFYTFTSIAALLCILLIYNVFVINSLSISLKNARSLKIENAYSSSLNYENENNYIELENGSKIELEEYSESKVNMQNNNGGEFEQTNWFNELVNKISYMFGG